MKALRRVGCKSFQWGLAALLVGCGGGDFYSGPSGTLAKAKAGTVLSQLSQTITNLSATSAPGAPSYARDFSACKTTTPETPVDADGDHIHAERTVTYACTDVAFGNHTGSQNGTFTEQDKDDNSTTAGYRFEYDITGGHSGGENYVSEGFFDFANSGGTTVYTTNYKSTGSQTARRDGTREAMEWEYGHTYNFTMTPDNANDPLAGGAITMNGYYRYYVTGSDPVDVTLQFTSEGLTYQGTGCASFYKSGSYTLTDGAGNSLKVTFTDCNTKAETFNGEALAR